MKRAASILLAFIAAAALGGVRVERVPTDAELAACIDAATASATADPQECVQRTVIVGHCDDVPPPAPVTDVVFDPNAVRYAGPIGGGTYEPEPFVEIRPDGVAYTFTRVGVATRVAYSTCWEWRPPEAVVTIHYVPASEEYVPPLAPDALAGDVP